MFRYGKLARQAVSAVSYLAEKHTSEPNLISSSEVGKNRNIPIALAAKLLSQMAAAGLTVGITGPHGGYRLARAPSQIHLAEIVSLFERGMEELPCPIGKGSCSSGELCPLHDDFMKMDEHSRSFLEKTTLQVFVKKGAHRGKS